MTTTIKKIRNYALLGTIISASATAPAQASSLKNNNSHDLIQNPLLEASKASKDISSEIEVTEKPDYCISFPESELCNQLTKEENQNSLNNPLFRKAKNLIESFEAAQTTKVRFVKGHKYTIYNAESNQSDSEELLRTTIYASASVRKEKVPEPSALIGLIALFLLSKKRQTATNSDVFAE
ncbi:MAG: PEP-CTERM sorting domain-containing protein [Cyanobacteriota bacterium]|nr:PEP-CTERM sorting domain-containing protein [Cyanobacteriota bacterium]